MCLPEGKHQKVFLLNLGKEKTGLCARSFASGTSCVAFGGNLNQHGFGLLLTKIGDDKRSHESLGAPWLNFFFPLLFL